MPIGWDGRRSGDGLGPRRRTSIKRAVTGINSYDNGNLIHAIGGFTYTDGSAVSSRISLHVISQHAANGDISMVMEGGWGNGARHVA